MKIINVLVPKNSLFPLSYLCNKDLQVGDLVQVPFRSKFITGVVWEINIGFSDRRLREVCIEQKFSSKLSKAIIDFIIRASDYYLADLGSILKLVFPVDVNEGPIKSFEDTFNSNIELPKLSDFQNQALQEILVCNKPVLLQGVTGSGKTEVYFHFIQKKLNLGKQVLIMLPEIALSKQMITRFSKRFGSEPAVWNSSISKAKKKRILRGIINGTTRLVIGARSALFLPYKNLGCIIVDEEHDQSYKQEQGVLYHARDMSVLRAHIEKCSVLLISATPSIESIHNTYLGKYQLVKINDRFNNAMMPDINIIDMKKEDKIKNSVLSISAINAIRYNLKKNQQSLVFLNRRGYAPMTICKLCGYRVVCKSCSASMVLYKSQKYLQCHHCDYRAPIIKTCPECLEDSGLTLYGAGIERIEEEIRQHFPDSNIAIISKDQTSSSIELQTILNDMESGKIDILIGTQVITKGYHFPKLTLVIVANADIGFIGSDLRAAERTFQILEQVRGRAGRGSLKGSVLIQTYDPNNSVILALANGDMDKFFREEREIRKLSNMPPFSRIAAITITGKDPEKTLEAAKRFVAKAPLSEAKIWGPSEANILKVSNCYRYKILVITTKNFFIQKYLSLWVENSCISTSFQLKIDVDPHNFV